MTLFCVCGVDSFIPELEHLIEKLFHGLFSKNKPLKSGQLLPQRKTFPTRLLGLLEKRSKIWKYGRSELTFRKVSLGKWSEN